MRAPDLLDALLPARSPGRRWIDQRVAATVEDGPVFMTEERLAGAIRDVHLEAPT